MTRHYTKLEKQTFIEQFQVSDLTQIAFCKTHILNLKTFNKWLKDSKAAALVSKGFSSHPNLSNAPYPKVALPDEGGDFLNVQAPGNKAAFVPLRLLEVAQLQGEDEDLSFLKTDTLPDHHVPDSKKRYGARPFVSQPSLAPDHFSRARIDSSSATIDPAPRPLCLKIHGFSLDIPSDLSADFKPTQSYDALKCVIQILHQLPDRGLS